MHVNRCPGWHRGRRENRSTKREWHWIRQWLFCCNQAKTTTTTTTPKVPRHTKHGPDINGCSHSHTCCTIAFQGTCAEYIRTCAVSLRPSCYCPSVPLMSICLHSLLCLLFTVSLLLFLHLSHKWPSVLISFVRFLLGRCRTFVVHL